MTGISQLEQYVAECERTQNSDLKVPETSIECKQSYLSGRFRYHNFYLGEYDPLVIAYDNDTMVYKAAYQMLFLRLIPFVTTAISAFIMNMAEMKLLNTSIQTGCVLSIIKRIQLTSLGRTLSHPLPPISRVEDTLLSPEYCQDSRSFVCKEMRSELKTTLIAFLRDALYIIDQLTLHFGTYNRNNELFEMLNVLKEYRNKVHSVITNNANAIPMSKYLEQLMHLVLQDVVPFLVRCHDSYLVHSNEVTSATGGASLLLDSLSWNDVMHGFVRAYFSIFSLPLSCVRLLSAIDCCNRNVVRLSSGLVINQSSSVNNVSLNDIDSSSASTNNGVFNYSSVYLTARSELTALRARYEGIAYRLWLCEKELAICHSTQYLLPDAMIRANQKESPCDLPSSTIAALAHLHGVSISEMVSDLQCVSSDSQLMDRLAHFQRTLPSFHDLEKLDSVLRVLIRGPTAAVSEPLPNDHATSSSRDVNQSSDTTHESGSSSSDVSTIRNTRSNVSLYSQDNLGDDTSSKNISMDKNVTLPVLELYTTVVPKQHLNEEKRRDRSELKRLEADREQEKLHAKSLLFELNTTLTRNSDKSTVKVQRVRTIVENDVVTESCCDIQSSADDVTILSDDTNSSGIMTTVDPVRKQLGTGSDISHDRQVSMFAQSLMQSGFAMDLRNGILSSGIGLKTSEESYSYSVGDNSDTEDM